MKPSIGPYRGTRVRLRLLLAEDLPVTMLWRNKDRCRGAFRNTDPISDASHRLWFEGYLVRENDFVFIIESLKVPGRTEGLRIGQISLYDVNPRASEAELGRMMIGDDAFLRSGCALEAVNIVLGEIAPALGLSGVYLEVRKENDAAIALYRQAGFLEDGHFFESSGAFVRMSIDVPGESCSR